MGGLLRVTIVLLLVLAVVLASLFSLWEWITLSLSPGYDETKTACKAITGISAILMCPFGTHELFRSTSYWGIPTERYCCSNNGDYYSTGKPVDSLCKSSNCNTSNSTNYCESLGVYYANNGNTQRDLVEVLRESCSINGEEGVISECCLSGSSLDYQAVTMGADPNEFPHMARLIIYKNGSKYGECGGTIYNSRWIITAAHCVDNQALFGQPVKPEEVEVIIGTNLPGSGNGVIYNGKTIIVHPSYSGSHFGFKFDDIALVELVNEINFTAKIKALEIAPKDFNPSKYAAEVVRVGWGTTALRPDMSSPFLHKSNLLIRTIESYFLPILAKSIDKQDKWKHLKENLTWSEHSEQLEGIFQNIFVAGGIYDNKWSPIAGPGDSGGPAICRGPNGSALLCGVASRSRNFEKCKQDITNGEMCFPNIFTKVSNFHDWIKETAGEQDSTTFYKPQLYGKSVPKGGYPHQVHITSQEEKPCGGTLIASDFVITAAHCVKRPRGGSHQGLQVFISQDETNMYGVSGVVTLPGFQMDGSPVNTTKHGNYITVTDNYFKNDLALLKLDRKVDNTSYQFPAISKMYKPEQGTELAYLRGKGTDMEMRSRNFVFLEMGQCQSVFYRAFRGKNSSLNGNLICGVEKYSGGSTCDRELGGGVICKGKDGVEILCGVQVFRYCESSIPNLFLNIGLYADWISESMVELSRPA